VSGNLSLYLELGQHIWAQF